MSTGASSLGAVSVAVYAALNVAGFTALCPGGIFEDIPQGTTTYPVSWYTVREEFGGGQSLSQGGRLVTLRLRSWDTEQTQKDNQAVHSKAAELLDNSTRGGFTPLTITGWTCPLLRHVATFPLPDDEVAGTRVKALESVFELTLVQS